MGRLLVKVEEVRADADPGWLEKYLVPKNWDCESCHLILALDADRPEHGLEGMTNWLLDFRKMVQEKNINHHSFHSTVFVLGWPEVEEDRFGEEGLDSLVLAGACYRPKTDEFYRREGDDLAEDLRRDLIAREVIPQNEIVDMGEPQAPPVPPLDDPAYRARMAYYTSPPFILAEELVSHAH